MTIQCSATVLVSPGERSPSTMRVASQDPSRGGRTALTRGETLA